MGVLAGAVALAAVAPASASADAVATCSAKTPVLQFQVDRNATGRDRTRRAISLQYGGGSSAAAIKPIRLTIVRGGKTRTMQLSSLNSEYRYRARKGERAAFMAVYAEDSSGYGQSTTAPPMILQPLVGVSPGLLGIVFGLVPAPLLQVLVPTSSNPGAFSSDVCARVQPLVVQEKAAPSSSRSRG